MRVFKIYPAKIDTKDFPRVIGTRRAFFTNNPWELTQIPVGSLVEAREMTDAEYKAIPATPEAAKFFNR